MPYGLRKKDNGKYQVVNTETGKVMGPEKTREDARKQLAALEINVKKVLSTTSVYLTITKSNDDERIVEGYATSEDVDQQPGEWNDPKLGKVYYVGDLVKAYAIEEALPEYMQFANLREQHDETKAVGVVLAAKVIKGAIKVGERVLHNPLKIIAKISDPVTWQKVKDGTLKGFSIKGGVYDLEIVKMAGQFVRVIKSFRFEEISLVDRPANAGAQVTLWKGANMKTVKGTSIAKAADPKKAVTLLQELRNQCEMSGDLDKAGDYTNAIALILQAEGAEPAVSAEPMEEAEGEHEELGKEPPDEGAIEPPSEEEKEAALDSLTEEPNEEEEAKADDKVEKADEESEEEPEDKKEEKKDDMEKAATKPAGQPVDVVSKAQFAALQKSYASLQKSHVELQKSHTDLQTQMDQVTKGLAKDIAQVILKIDEVEKALDEAKARPVLREIPVGGFQGNTSIEIMKGLLDQTQDPGTRQVIQNQIAEMEIKALNPNYVGFSR